MSADSETVKEALEEQSKPIIEMIRKEDYLSSGSTLVNLACSSTSYGAFCKGKFFWMVGSSSSGKTWLTLNGLAEAAINPNFKEYDLIYNNIEDGALMDVRKYFGSKLQERLKPPDYDSDGAPKYSEHVEGWYYHLDQRLTLAERGKAPPFIELVDSFDALSSDYEEKKFTEHRKAFEKAEKKAENKKSSDSEDESKTDAAPKGDYGDGKAKIHSRYMRGIIPRLRDTGSIVIGLSQERDNITGGMFDPANVVSGGRALKFYATWQLWSCLGAKISKKVNDTNRQIGITSRISVKKNRLTGKEWTIDIPMHWSSGIDEVGSLVQFMIDENQWKKSNGKIIVPDFSFEGAQEKLIRKIEEEDLEFELRSLVTLAWREIEAKCEVVRKPRYT